MTVPNDQDANLTWYKAHRSNGSGACVEVATAAGSILVRDSKDPHGPVLAYTKAEWGAFLDGAKKGEFDSFCV